MKPAPRFYFRVVASVVFAVIAMAPGYSADLPVARPVPATSAKAIATAVTFDSFRLLTERNIFNPNRVGHAGAGPAAPPAGEEIRLVGTLDSTQGLFAFFDSPDATYRQALHEGGAIAGFTVKHIGQDRVELLRDTGPASLRIGQLLHRPIGGDWSVATHESLTPTETTSPASPAVAAIPADASDTLKRLLMQRQKQLQP